VPRGVARQRPQSQGGSKGKLSIHDSQLTASLQRRQARAPQLVISCPHLPDFPLLDDVLRIGVGGNKSLFAQQRGAAHVVTVGVGDDHPHDHLWSDIKLPQAEPQIPFAGGIGLAKAGIDQGMLGALGDQKRLIGVEHETKGIGTKTFRPLRLWSGVKHPVPIDGPIAIMELSDAHRADLADPHHGCFPPVLAGVLLSGDPSLPGPALRTCHFPRAFYLSIRRFGALYSGTPGPKAAAAQAHSVYPVNSQIALAQRAPIVPEDATHTPGRASLAQAQASVIRATARLGDALNGRLPGGTALRNTAS